MPTPGGGAMLHAYLLPATPANRGGDLAAIIAESNAHLAQHQRVATASWWDGADFPRTALFKVRRHLLPQAFAARLQAVTFALNRRAAEALGPAPPRPVAAGTL